MSAWVEAPDYASITVETEPGKPTPIKDIPFFKDTPDLPTFLKRAHDTHREVGSRIPIKIDATKPEQVENWRKEHLPKLYQAGVLQAPPTKVEEYGIARPAEMDAKLWSDESAKKLGEVALKYGISKAAIPELLALHNERVAGVDKALQTTYEQGIEGLKTEWGARYDEVMEKCKRFTDNIFKTPEELAFFEASGIGNHPGFLSVMSRLADRAGNDSSIIPNAGAGGGGMTLEQVTAEHQDIMSNPQNPRHKLYWAGDKATSEYIDELYRKIPGASDKVTLG